MSAKQHPMAAVSDKLDLAFTYMQDGAFYTAVARLREAADILEQHAKACDAALAGEKDQ